MTPAVALATDNFPTRSATHRSSVLAALTTPWRSTKRQTIWIALVIFVLGCAAAVICGVLMPNARGQVLAMIFYAAGVCFVWAFWFSGLLLVARDARMLALPGVLRDTLACALAYGVLMIAVPALIEGAFGWSMARPAMLSAFAMAAGLTFVLSPRWVSMCMGFMPALYSTVHETFHVLSPMGLDFLHWGTAAAVALFAFVTIRWRRILHDDSAEACGWRVPMILQLRQQAVSSGWSFDKQMFWKRDGRQHRYTDLRGIGARAPVKTIRVALGGELFMPRTPAGNFRRLGVLVWPVLIFVGCMLLTSIARIHNLHKLLVVIGVSGAMWSGAFGMAMLLFAVTAMLRRRWEHGAEPALLALLPGLGRHAPLHRSVVRAAFVKPFGLCVALWALMAASEYLLHLGALAYALTTLILLGMTAATVLSLLRVFAGRALGNVAQASLIIIACILMGVSLPLIYVTPVAKLGTIAEGVEWGLLAAWLVFAGCMGVLALRAWRVFRLRPHPFLSR
ncbi:MAG: hypothetical protein OJF61_002685 [Rhodanobacteraceae bacterium]|jgi:hypothetical protein|nr:MAG: hypothetical protein OJF61_002685 [Rhodanobacteraceae bacterium]